MPDRPLQVAVLGGGIAGLATAFDLQTAARARGCDLRISLFESGTAPGGKLRTIRQDGYRIEAGPNGWLDNEPATARLISRLGIEAALQRSEDATRHRFLLIDGRLHELPLSPPAFLKSGVLSPRAKLRVAAEPFIRPRKDLGRADDDPATDETVFDFGRRRLGREFAERMLDPMVKGIFGGDARRLSLAAAFPRMVQLERDHGGLFKALLKLGRQKRRDGKSGPSAAGPAGTLMSFRQGMQVLPEALERALAARPLNDRPATRVWPEMKAWWLTAGGERYGPFAAVIDATPAHAAAEHLPEPELCRLLAKVPYAPMAVVTLAFARDRVEHPLRGFGMLNPSRERRRLLGVLWSSSIFKGRAPRDKVLLRCMAGGATTPEIMDLSDDRLLRTCLEELGPLYGLRGEPERAWIIRHERAIAQYETGHLARLKAVDDILNRLPGLFLTGSSYRGVSVNHCIAAAEKTAESVMEWLVRTGKLAAKSETSRPREQLSQAAAN